MIIQKSAERQKGLTFIELLIVAAIIALLAAIALPNYLEAHTRSKVAAASNNIRVLSNALEVYALDNNHYPMARRVFPTDRLGILADIQLDALRSPVEYVSASSFHDPFSKAREISYFRERNGEPAPRSLNPGKALLYYNYRYLAESWGMPCLERHGAAVVSLGPDQQDSLGAYRPFDPYCFSGMYRSKEAGYHPVNTEYDPTNGTLSQGDIAGFAGTGRMHSYQ